MHSSEHEPLVVVYKVDYFVKRSLLSSLVLLNTRVVLLSDSKNFSSQQYLGQQYINRKESFSLLFLYHYVFPALSDISQNHAEVLEKQWQKMQQRHKKKQRLLAQLEEVAKLCQAERMAQKARREVEKKAWKEAERQRVAEEEERKRRMMEYLQWLRDEVLEEEAALLERAEGS